MKYDTPEMEVVKLEVDNIIITSFDGEGNVTPDGETVITPGKPGSWG